LNQSSPFSLYDDTTTSMEKRCEPDTFIDSIKKKIQKQWVYEDGKIVHRKISYVPGLYNIFDIVLVHAADKKRRDPSMDWLKVKIDTEMNEISVSHNGAPLIGDETFDDVINIFHLTNSYSTCFWVEFADEKGISRQVVIPFFLSDFDFLFF